MTHLPTHHFPARRNSPLRHRQPFGRLSQILLPVAALLCQTFPASALDLQQAQTAALAQDARVRASRANALAEAERIPQAEAQLRPLVQASLGTNRNDLDTTGPNFLGQVSTSNRKYTSSSNSLSLRQPLFRKQASANLAQAQYLVDDAQNQLNFELQNLSVRLGAAYFQALLASDQLGLIEARKNSTRIQLDAAQKALARGTGIRTDIDLAQARLDQVAADELDAVQNVDYTRRQLEALINEPATTLATLDTTRLVLNPPEPAQLEHWVALAIDNSPEVKSAQARLDASRLELEKANAGHYPTVDLVAQWSKSKSDNVTATSQEYDNKSVGLQVNIPLYSGGYVNSSERQALARITVAEETLESVSRDLRIRVQKEYGEVSAKVLQVKALEQASRSADVALDSSKKSYAAGARTLLDVLNAEQDKQTADRNVVQARYEYLAARLRLAATTNVEITQRTITEINGFLAPVNP